LRRWCLHAAHDDGGGEGADAPLLSDDGAACGGEDEGALLLVGTRAGGEDEDGSEEYDGEADPDDVAPPDDEDHVGASCAAGGVGMLLRNSQAAHAGCCPLKPPSP